MKIKIRQINDEDSHSSINKSVHDYNSVIKVVFEVPLNDRIQLENHLVTKSHSVTDLVLDDDVTFESIAEMHIDGSKLIFAQYIEEGDLKVLAKALMKK